MTDNDESSGSLAEVEEAAIRRAVEEANGNISAAARSLGIDRNKIYRRLKRD